MLSSDKLRTIEETSVRSRRSGNFRALPAPTPIRDRRRVLRYLNLVQRQSIQMKNRISGLLMETGVSYNKLRLHRMSYFQQLLSTSEEIGDNVRPLLNMLAVDRRKTGFIPGGTFRPAAP